MDKTWWRITQVIFMPLIVAILFTAVREIVLEVSGDATVTTNALEVGTLVYTNSVKLDGYLVSTNAHFYIQAAKEFGALTNLVNELVTSGEFCRVRGHVWHYGAKGENYYGLTFDTEFKTARRCAVCGKIETRVDKPWK